MNIVVLLSAGCHPVSGRPTPVGVEMQAIRMACDLGATPIGLHVGAASLSVTDALGHGLARLDLLAAGEASRGDPVPLLAEYLRAASPDIILAGRRGQGGSDTGMLSYRLAHVLGWNLLPDVVNLTVTAQGLLAEQALPLGARRAVNATQPLLATVHPSARPAFAFRYSGLRGEIRRIETNPMPPLEAGQEAGETRPYRQRPKLIEQQRSDQSGTGGRVLRGLTPGQAAAEIIAELHRLRIGPPQ